MGAQMINALIGLIIIISPGILEFTKTEANMNHILGPIIFTFALISWWECNRNVRLFNIVTGACLILGALLFKFQHDAFLIDIISGILIILFSLVKRKPKQMYGGGWRALFMNDPIHLKSE